MQGAGCSGARYPVLVLAVGEGCRCLVQGAGPGGRRGGRYCVLQKYRSRLGLGRGDGEERRAPHPPPLTLLQPPPTDPSALDSGLPTHPAIVGTAREIPFSPWLGHLARLVLLLWLWSWRWRWWLQLWGRGGRLWLLLLWPWLLRLRGQWVGASRLGRQIELIFKLVNPVLLDALLVVRLRQSLLQ